MFSFFAPVTELKAAAFSSLQLKVFISDSENGGKGLYLKDYQVDIKKHGKVSSDKYVDLESYLVRKIELRVFTNNCDSGLKLTPMDIQTHARLVFKKSEDYETTGKVEMIRISKADLQKHHSGRRGFRMFPGKKASHDEVPPTSIKELSNEYSSTNLEKSGQSSEEQSTLHQPTEGPLPLKHSSPVAEV